MKLQNILFIILFTVLLASGCTKRPNLPAGQEKKLGQTTFPSVDSSKENYDLFPVYRLVPGDTLDVLFQIQALREVERYTITANDIISIKFVRFPDLNETQHVRPDGNVSLPYVGDVYVVGKTPAMLRAELEEEFGKYFRNPELYVKVEEYRERIKELKQDLHTASRGLSRLVTVRPDGYATFPLAGDIFVAGKPIPEIKKELDTFYGGYLKGLHVDLFLQEHAGAVVYVLGMVEKAGAYKINKPVTILQALALAGGPKLNAKLDTVMVYRKSGNRFLSTRVEVDQVLATEDDSQLFYLRPDDVVYLSESRFFETARVMKALADIIMFRGWGFSFDSKGIQSPFQ